MEKPLGFHGAEDLGGTPVAGWFHGKSYHKIDDLGVPP